MIAVARGRVAADSLLPAGCPAVACILYITATMRTFIPVGTQMDFLRWRRQAYLLSALLVLGSLALVGLRGLNAGLDFTGGTVIELQFERAPELDRVRETVEAFVQDTSSVQRFGSSTELLIRLAPSSSGVTLDAAQAAELAGRLDDIGAGNVEIRRVESMGPQVGQELTEKGGLAMLIALGCIFAYVAIRYEKRLSAGAVVALLHDVTITLGVFALTRIEFDLSVLAALLAVIGYSLNDTIVIFDRIRDEARRHRHGELVDLMNRAISDTMMRTINTGLTTLLVLLSLLLFGGDVLRGFSVALITGVLIGTYSSVFVASALALQFGLSHRDLVPPVDTDPDVIAQ